MQTISLKEFQKRLSNLAKDFNNKKEILNEIGILTKNKSEESFEKQSSPFGERWKANAPATLAQKRGNKILTQSGLLRTSLTYKLGNQSVTIGTNKEYASIHQFGGKAGRGKKVIIPARPFLPINNKGEIPKDFGEELLKILEDTFRNNMEGR
ncbi:phage virion morphogenesis protein [Helicobacter sp. 14348-15]|uniref:phage virion morphogenesis protein n=1 Tax=Helicobacter colisuis TaxID=2949739 RepID=UPI00202B1D92|nr:phage virion morphogenesis protein [Helicobacter colisuis]MCL9820946.1 phage virion morphogenesis protein [Helicobacter colisuis]